jgi:hypothetical protein
MPFPLAKLWNGFACRALLAAWWLSLALPTAPAQEAENIHYTHQKSFLIPFVTDRNERRIRQLLLHVSEDHGKTYQVVANASPGGEGFQFTARHDGWYWFAVQTLDTEGRYHPSNPALAPPGLKVCVDTTPPQVSLKSVLPDKGTVGVEWDLRDDNLDLNSLRLEYRRQGGTGDWITLNTRKDLPRAQFGWSPAGAGPFEVRLTVNDKAGNKAQGAVAVAKVPGRPDGPGDPGPVTYVRSKKIRLNYTFKDVGPSNVNNVEVWTTRDTRSWTRYRDDAPAAGPYTLEVAGEGRWGITLIPRSGVGLADQAPKLGDQPQRWIEVDFTRPVVALGAIEVGRGPDQGKMTVHWKATDKFLRAQPITLSYSATAEGPWMELAAKLENTGVYTVDCQRLPFQFYVRVEAIDEAGNIGSAQTRETVKVDLKIPKVEKLDVEGVEAAAGGEAPPPAK